jgi:hypothetical protein
MLHLEHQMAEAQMAQIQQPKEFKMFSHRLFNIFVAIALILVIGFTVREVAATATMVSSTSPADTACDNLPSHASIHTEYSKETGTWMTYSEDGPTGVDGGLIYLLSARQACTR